MNNIVEPNKLQIPDDTSKNLGKAFSENPDFFKAFENLSPELNENEIAKRADEVRAEQKIKRQAEQKEELAKLEEMKNDYIELRKKLAKDSGYEKIGLFHDGLAKVLKKQERGFIDKTGKEIIPVIYDDANPFSEGIAGVGIQDKYSFIDTQGNKTISVQDGYDYVGSFHEGVARVKSGSRYRYIDKTGRPLNHDFFEGAADFKNGYAIIKDGRYGVVDKKRNKVVPCEYDYIEDFHDGLARVRNSDAKYGYIDITGKKIIPLKNDEASAFSDGIAIIKENQKRFFIDTSGNKLKEISKYAFVLGYAEGLALVVRGGKYGFIDRTGTEVIPCEYKEANVFIDGRALVQKGNKRGCIDRSGNEVIPFIYDYLWKMDDGMLSAKIDNDHFSIFPDGTRVGE